MLDREFPGGKVPPASPPLWLPSPPTGGATAKKRDVGPSLLEGFPNNDLKIKVFLMWKCFKALQVVLEEEENECGSGVRIIFVGDWGEESRQCSGVWIFSHYFDISDQNRKFCQPIYLTK